LDTPILRVVEGREKAEGREREKKEGKERGGRDRREGKKEGRDSLFLGSPFLFRQLRRSA
jgi:hypothetical protein